MIYVKKGQAFFSQGGLAHSIFFLDSGRAKLTVVSKREEATVTMIAPGDYIGEESLAGSSELHEVVRSGFQTGNNILTALFGGQQDNIDVAAFPM